MPRVVVVGAGLSGLAIAHHLLRGARPLEAGDVTVLEAAGTPGGLLRTTRREGYLVEWAANAFQAPAPATEALLRALSLSGQLVTADATQAKRFVVHRGRLVALPSKPPGLLTTRLLSPAAKLRLLREPKIPPPANGKEESVADFATRRLGEGVLPLADAFVTGVTAGDPARLSLDHAFPRLRAMERDHGSVFAALQAARKRGGGDPKPTLVSLREGMGFLPEVLAKSLPVRLGARVERVEEAERGLSVVTGNDTLEAEAVVLAVAPRFAARMLGKLREWPGQREAPVAVVGLGFEQGDAPGAQGFGYLAPEREGRFALGAVNESVLFPGRAPEGKVLVRALVGGVRHPDRADLPDDILTERVVADLSDLRVVRGNAEFTHVARHPSGLPQLEMGHGALLARAQAAERRWPGLHFAGVGWRTITVNGLLEEAAAVAERVRTGLVG